MFDNLGRAIKEIRKGENIDLYLTVLLAIVVAILGITGVANFEIISAVMLAILGLIANSLLASRRSTQEMQEAAYQLKTQFEKLQQEIRRESSIAEVLSKGYPNLAQEIRSAKNVSIVAIYLSGELTRYYSDFAQVLKQGGTLRFLLSESSPKTLQMMVYRSSSRREPETVKTTIKDTLARMKTLRGVTSNADLLQVKAMPYVTSYGIIIIDSIEGNSKAYIKLTGFRNTGSEQPVFKLDEQTDKDWFEYFRNQFNTMWSAGQEVL